MEWTRSSKGTAAAAASTRCGSGVLVLDADDRPVLVNPAAREMGLLRPAVAGAPAVAHAVIRTLAGQVRRTGARREVELDLPRGAGAASRSACTSGRSRWTMAT